MKRLSINRELALLAAVVCITAAAKTQELPILALGVAAGVASLWLPTESTHTAWWVVAIAGSASIFRSYHLDSSVSWIWLVVAIALIALSILFLGRKRGVLCLALAGYALIAFLSVGTLFTWGAVPIDTFQDLQIAGHAVASLQNPYSVPVPAGIFNFAKPEQFTTIHFQYLPVIAILVAPFAVLGDVRVAGLLALAAFALVLLGLVNRKAQQLRIGALMSASAAVPLMLLYGWTDVYAAPFIAFWIMAGDRWRWPRRVALGLAVATSLKIWPAFLPFIIWSNRARFDALWGGVVAAVLIVPFALWTGISNFIYDVALVQIDLFPLRLDSLSIDAFANKHGLPLLPWWAGLAIAGLVTIGLLLRRPRDMADCCAVAAIILVVAFATSKQAFLNYYFNSIVLLFLALAVQGKLLGDSPQSRRSVLGGAGPSVEDASAGPAGQLQSVP